MSRRAIVLLVGCTAPAGDGPSVPADRSLTDTTDTDTSSDPTQGSGDTGRPGTADTGVECPPGGLQRRLEGELVMATAAFAIVDGIPGTYFGFDVASMGDATGDGLAELTVATLLEERGTDVGGVYLLPSPLPPGVSGVGAVGSRFVDRDGGAGYDYWCPVEYGGMGPVPDLTGDGLSEILVAGSCHRPVETIGGGSGTAYIVGTPLTAVPGYPIQLEPSYAWFTGDDVSQFAASTEVRSTATALFPRQKEDR